MHREPQGEVWAGEPAGVEERSAGGGERGGKFSMVGDVSHRPGFHQQGWDRRVVLSGDRIGVKNLLREQKVLTPEEPEGLGETWGGAQERGL